MGCVVQRNLFLLLLMCFADCGIRFIAGTPLVGDPEMQAARATGMTEQVSLSKEERGETYCATDPNREFRTIDGACNNLRNKGATNTPLRRMVEPPAYERGTKGEPRVTGASGHPLPSPRVVSELIHPDKSKSRGLNEIFMLWGQAIDDDLSVVPLPTETDSNIICCGPDNVGLADPLPEECNPIRFPPGDSDFKGDCMEFVRSEEAKEDYGTSKESKFREQRNAQTAFVDASMVYGSEEEVARALRTDDGKGAFLRVSIDRKQGPLLPRGPFPNCSSSNPDKDLCTSTGDDRANEQPGLRATRTIFQRLHNVIAKGLLSNRPSLSEEEVYQRARRLVGAITQNILYGQWLPILLGRRTMNRYGLTTRGYSSYVPSIDPSVLQEFSTAAFRLEHTLGRLRDHFRLARFVRESFNDNAESTAEVLNPEHYPEEPTWDLDLFLQPAEVSRSLVGFKPNFTLDLMSRNIHRGRDHGLPPYNEVRRACGLSPVTSFDSNAFNGSPLRGVYADTDDVDLLVGGLLEAPVSGGLVGPTFTCIIAKQFADLKFGDRFFFETSQHPGRFAEDQLEALRNVTMSVVMCATTGIRMIPLNAFRVPSSRNPVKDCDDLRLKLDTMIDSMTKE